MNDDLTLPTNTATHFAQKSYILGDQAECNVCGKDVRHHWAVRMHTAKRSVYLCSAPCALSFFERTKARAHDCQAPGTRSPASPQTRSARPRRGLTLHPRTE